MLQAYDIGVVYFDQPTGAPHAIPWSQTFVSVLKQVIFLHYFIHFMTEIDLKSCFSIKKCTHLLVEIHNIFSFSKIQLYILGHN